MSKQDKQISKTLQIRRTRDNLSNAWRRVYELARIANIRREEINEARMSINERMIDEEPDPSTKPSRNSYQGYIYIRRIKLNLENVEALASQNQEEYKQAMEEYERLEREMAKLMNS